MSEEFRRLKARADEVNKKLEATRKREAKLQAELDALNLQLQTLVYEGDGDD